MNTVLVRILAALAIFSCALTARSVPLSPDPTGLWFDPAQPGWGLEVAQQGETVFAVVFTYDTNHKPVWYVASNVVDTIDYTGLPGFQGTLYRTTGPAFSASTFDPRNVDVIAVGQLLMSNVVGSSPRQLRVTYVVDGVEVSKTLRAQTWSTSAQDLLGAYGGQFFVSPAAGQSPLCPDPAQLLLLPIQPFQGYGFSLAAGSRPDHATLLWGSGIDLGCMADMAFQRDGQLGSLSGALQCGPIGFVLNGSGVPIVVSNIVMGQSGISGGATVQTNLPGGLACTYQGTFGGVVTSAPSRLGMTPDPTGVWFNPAESGWGLILTQQGDNIFAAVFAYDADNKPTWWVASNVVAHGDFPGLGQLFGGTLYRTTGPYFGTADATPLSVTPVGPLQILYEPDTLSLMYTVDGTTVTKGSLVRQTWASNKAWLANLATGGLFPTASCGTGGFFATNPTTFTLTSVSASSLQLKWPTGNGTGCVLDAAYAQTGQLATLSGPVHCGAIDNPQAAPGTITISSATVGADGFAGVANFTSFATLDGPSCSTFGFIGGVRR